MTFRVKGTPPNYDARTAADYLLNFNSDWPLLKLHETGVFSGTVTHNLGYPPFHTLATSDGRIDQFASNYGVNSTSLARSSGAGSPRYFIFRLDLTTNFTAPNLETSTASNSGSADYVFKMTKPGKSTDSTDLRDFALHSNTRSPALHSVNHGTMSNTGGGLGWERTVTHNLGYTPIAFAFIKPGTNALALPTDRYLIVSPPVGVTSFYYTVSSTSIYVTADNIDITDTPSVSVVILKDPFTKDIINVSFP